VVRLPLPPAVAFDRGRRSSAQRCEVAHEFGRKPAARAGCSGITRAKHVGVGITAAPMPGTPTVPADQARFPPSKCATP